MSQKTDAHGLIAAIKTMTLDLGVVPTRRQFVDQYGWGFEKHFGGFTQLVHAAGLKAQEKSDHRKVAAQLVKAKIESELASPIKPKRIDLYAASASEHRIICIGDLHAPVTSADALTGLYALIEDYRPSIIASVGDAFDMFAQSRFAKTLNWMTPQAEYEAARKQLGEMWSTIGRIAPNARLIQIAGNHGMRPQRRMLEVAPDLEHFIDMQKILGFDGVETFTDPRQIIMLTPDVELTHGDHTSRALNYALERNHNIVHGHDHRGSISMVTTSSGKQLWVASSGHMADLKGVPMQYTFKEKPNWQRGVTLIDGLGPRFVSL